MMRVSGRYAAWLALAVLLAIGLLILPGGASAWAQDEPSHLERYDSQITVNTDGSLDVEERLVFAIENGSSNWSWRTWSLDVVEDVNDVRVAEETGGSLTNYRKTAYNFNKYGGDMPWTYDTKKTRTLLQLRWTFDSFYKNSRAFRISYHVDGAVRVYGSQDLFAWYAVPQWESPIDSSRVRVTFPPGSNTSNWAVYSIPKSADQPTIPSKAM